MRFLAPVVDVHQDEADGCGPVAGETWRTPLEGGRFVFLLSGTLAATSALGAALDLFHLGEMVLRASSLLLIVAWGGATALVVAYGCRFLDSVVAYSLCGGAKSIDLPDHDSRSAIISLARWILCFFPVPAFLI